MNFSILNGILLNLFRNSPHISEIIKKGISGKPRTRMSQFKPQEDLVTLTKQKLKPPVQFKVLLHNDDYTTMDFVVRVLEAVFHKTADEAIQIMLQVHKTGVGICGVYSHEVAETKVEAVHEMARQNEFPLKASMEEV